MVDSFRFLGNDFVCLSDISGCSHTFRLSSLSNLCEGSSGCSWFYLVGYPDPIEVCPTVFHDLCSAAIGVDSDGWVFSPGDGVD